MLLKDSKMGKNLHNGFIVVSKKPQTLGNILSPSFFVPQTSSRNWQCHRGIFKCGGHLCKSCSFAIQTNYFGNFDKTKSYPIRQYITVTVIVPMLFIKSGAMRSILVVLPES